MQVEKRRLRGLGLAVLAQVERQLLLDGRPVLLQLEPGQLALEVGLDRRLADALGQLADGRADVDAGQGLLDRRQLAVAESVTAASRRSAQRRGQAVLQRRQRLRQPHAFDHFGRRAMRARFAQVPGDQRQVPRAADRARSPLVERVPEQLEVGRGVVAGAVARLRRELEVRIRHQRELARPPAERGQLVVGHRRELAGQHRRVKRADDGDDLLRLVPGGDRLVDPPPHERLADEVLRPPARRVLLQLAQRLAELERGQAVAVVADVVLEVPFPVGVVVRLAGQLGELLVERLPRLRAADVAAAAARAPAASSASARPPSSRSAALRGLFAQLRFDVLQAEEDRPTAGR